MRSAQSLGAELRVPASFVAAQRRDDGWNVDYLDGGNPVSCRTAAIVNASGAGTNEALEHISPRPPIFPVELVQGAHIVVAAPTVRGVYYVEAPDRRAVFVMPWKGKSLVGTTETVVRGEIAAVQPQEVSYLQDIFRHYFPGKDARVVDSFAGVRVLPSGGSSVFHRSRGAVFLPDDPARPRVVTIYGGKLTSYRATAAHVLDLLRAALPARNRRADTDTLPLTPD